MNVSGITKIETLTGTNYDTWKIHMRALLIKCDLWCYVNGEKKKPAIVEDDDDSVEAAEKWRNNDEKAMSEILLGISPAELKQVKNCTTSCELWSKLESIYQSKGPARKATLLKRLVLRKMRDGDDIREHLKMFFDVVDKLEAMEVTINVDLLSILLLYSLPPAFETFQCAIESRDDLPSPEALKIKIIEEYDARRENRPEIQNAMAASKNFARRFPEKKKSHGNETHNTDNESFRKFRCYKCKKIGHRASECRRGRGNGRQYPKPTDDTSLYASTNEAEALRIDLPRSDRWCLDSGCTSHLCNNALKFEALRESDHRTLNLASNASTAVDGRGNVSIVTQLKNTRRNVSLKDTLYVPDLRSNLLSVGKIADRGFTVVFDKKVASVIDGNGKTILAASRVGGLYYVEDKAADECRKILSPGRDTGSQRCSELELWHRRLGHVNVDDIRKAKNYEMIKGLEKAKLSGSIACEVCARGKMTRAPFPKEVVIQRTPLEIVHSDVCGPMRTESNGRSLYFVTFIDEATRWCEVRFLRKKNEVFQAFREYKSMAENIVGKKIKYLQSDNGREYCNREFDNFLRTHGIQRRVTVPRNPEQNGLAERKNRTLVEMARCLLVQSGLSASFWAEAVCASNYIRNRCPTRSLKKTTPFQEWYRRKPSVTHLREFGCKVFCLNTNYQKGKFEPRSREGVLVGYAEQSKGYRIWIPVERKIEISRDVKFLERVAGKPEGSVQDFEPVEITMREKRVSEEPSNETISIDRESSMDNAPEEENQSRQDIGVPRAETPKRGRGRPRILRTGLRGRPRKQFQPAAGETPRQDGEESGEAASTESEYMALAEAAKEAVFLREFLAELGCDKLAAVTIYNDNIGASKIACNPVFHNRTKHIDIRHHYVREVLKDGRINLEHISTGAMAADVLTKALSGPKHWKCLQSLGMTTRNTEPHIEGEC